LSADLTQLKQSTYLGGSNNETFLSGLAIHPASGDVYVVGQTGSSDFPVTPGAAQELLSGGIVDRFGARPSGDLKHIVEATYIGDTGVDAAEAVAINPTSGDVYVAGIKISALPQQTLFVARFGAGSLTSYTEVRGFGGSGTDDMRVLAVHPISGDVYVVGQTDSTDLPFTTGGAQPVNRGGREAFIVRFSAGLSGTPHATYLGGDGSNDEPLGIAIHPTSGNVYVAGQTNSTDFPA